MNAKAAKEVAESIREIAEASARIILIDGGVGCGPDCREVMQHRCVCCDDIEKAQKRIAKHLVQSTTEFHLPEELAVAMVTKLLD